MFIRSKNKDNKIAVRLDSFDTIEVDDFYEPEGVYYSILFGKTNEEMLVWKYKNAEDRSQEYEWILTQLDCRLNVETHKTCKVAELCRYGVEDISCSKWELCGYSKGKPACFKNKNSIGMLA